MRIPAEVAQGPRRRRVEPPLPDLDGVREELVRMRSEIGSRTIGDDCAELLLAAFALREQGQEDALTGRARTRWYFRKPELLALARKMRAIGRGAS